MVQAASFPQLILILMTDQFRHDGFNPDVTPNLYKLSLQPNTTTFANAYVSTPTCTPARAALLTGKSPWAHGMLGYAGSVDCPNYPATLPQVLADYAGYMPVAVGKNHFGWDANTGKYYAHGYQQLDLYEGLHGEKRNDNYTRYFHSRHPDIDDPLDITCHHLGFNAWQACPYGSRDEDEHPTAWTTREALHYLQNFDFTTSPDNRLFLKVSYHRPHSPYDPPQRLLKKYLYSYADNENDESLVPKRRLCQNWDNQYRNTTGPMQKEDWKGDPPEAEARHSRAGYLANCNFVDEGIGEILKWLKRHNDYHGHSLLDSSMTFWITDHGDMNGDHYLWRKGYPYEASSHVNMLVKMPSVNNDSAQSSISFGDSQQKAALSPTSVSDGLSEEQRKLLQPTTLRAKSSKAKLSATLKPKISHDLVELRDVAVTIYDYLGILEKVRLQDPTINGLSMLSILADSDTTNATKIRNSLDLEHSRVYGPTTHWNSIIGYRHDNNNTLMLWKYIFSAYDGSEQLFSLSNDRDECNDLSKDVQYEQILAYWRGIMVKQFESEKRGDQWAKDGELISPRPPILYGPNYPCRPQ